MRIDKLLSNRTQQQLTAAQYERLKSNSLLTFMYSQDGWDFSQLEGFTKDDARKWLHRLWKCQHYEQANNIEPHFWGMIFHIVNTQDGHNVDDPEWPEALQKIDTDCLAEAYLIDKFNIQKPQHYEN